MNSRISETYSLAQLISRLSALLTIFLFALFRLVSFEPSISLQIIIATIALAVGIPHGAVDHLISVQRNSKLQFAFFILGYIAIAIAAGVAIARWNQVGFQLVVLMSGLHFGFGDASFSNELKSAEGRNGNSIGILIWYAIPAGFLPLVLPLTDVRAASALQRINPHILGWAGSASELLRNIIICLAIFCILFLFYLRRFNLALDLALLVALSLIAPPLITFAVYFGCWHAIRHTARLVPKLPKSMALLRDRSRVVVLLSAFTPGLYAVAATLAGGGLLIVLGEGKDSYGLLWATLLIVWALTVPHMIATSRLDLKSIQTKS